ncbi:PilN domain-containing protein [Lysinibacillus sp. BW-2-10]|uniref:PilN domain-containing protein n=1 Tax=Lysinibacillus sp. BW-2-10 TaxID=2590030 RepID=UPI00117C47DE|nr:PilN domain-containing protein [Lysinibacillus sp. BW-2-10]TSI10127.1 PilN domain-containing protein [Lysinibacillus sp. BW-2-10]
MIPDINLLPKVERRRQADSKLLYVLLAIIVLLILSLLVWQYFNARSSVASMKNEEQALIAQRDQLQAEFDVLNGMSSSLSLNEFVEFLEILSYPVSPIINEAQNLQPNNSFLRAYEFSENSVTISLDFETLNAISDYVARLSNSGYFKDVQVSTISNFELVVETEEGSTDDTTNFNEQPRYSANITLLIDDAYLATGGVNE